MPGTPIVEVTNVRKRYPGGGGVTALDGVSLRLEAGTFTAIMGPSGAGKTTLLHSIAGLDVPDAGTITVAGEPMTSLSANRRAALRARKVGVIFQNYNLVPVLDVAQNIALPAKLSGSKFDKTYARHLAEELGISQLMRKMPDELSGGQQQRVAIARALAMRPAIIVADEPTGALDRATSAQVLGLLRQGVANHNATVLMVTHDPEAASYADRMINVVDGRIVADSKRSGVAHV